MVRDFDDFCKELLACGFSMGGGNSKGIYAIVPYDWKTQGAIETPVKWHTGDADTDPWEWRMRVLEERDDISYGKVFFKTSGFITKEWYPYFYAVRRKGESFAEAYENGTISNMAKRIYEIVSEDEMAVHEIKRAGCFLREDNASFERAITELQTRMFITISGSAQKINRNGETYGWSSMVFTTAEKFWERRGLLLQDLDPDESFEKIREQILCLNPEAKQRKIEKFVRG